MLRIGLSMFKIVRKREWAPIIKEIEVEAPEIARKAKPGQFVIVRVDEKGERIPLTIVDYDESKRTVTLIFQEVGTSTKKLGRLNEGDYIADVVGPLGNPTEIRKYGTVVCIGGGVGIGAIYPVARALKECGNYVISIIGARTSSLLILEDKVKSVSDELYITTDDGSKGRKGFTTDVLKELISKGRRIDLVYAVGPTIMMKVVADITRPYGIKTTVSLNPIMVDGSGMCGACRVRIGGEIKFACVDGPEFDAHLVDFNELLARLRMYREEEKLSLEIYERRVKPSEA